MNTKKIFFGLLLTTISLSLYSQNEKSRVAVFDPSSSGRIIDEGTKVAIREIISSTLVNTNNYVIVERSMLLQVMNEQKFSNSDMVDESQATEIGRLAGANKIILPVITMVGGKNMLSIKLIDVITATIDKQKTKIANTADLLDLIEPLTLELIGDISTPSITQTSSTINSQTATQVAQSESTQKDLMLGEISFADYKEARNLCRSSNMKGFNDWRLPTFVELGIIFKTNDFSELGGDIGWYWSTSCMDKKCEDLWVRHSKSGKKGTAPPRKIINVICVRAVN
jgi:hypothetical protein